MKQAPAIVIQNNTGSTIPINLLTTAAPDATLNAVNQYNWNVCSQLYVNLTTVTVQARLATDLTFTTYQANILTQSLDGVLAALNSLGIGTFVSGNISGVPNIIVRNDSFVYGSLSINNSSASNTISFQWLFTLNSPVGFSRIQVADLTQATLLFASFPNVFSGSQTAAGVVAGDTIQFQYVINSVGAFSGSATLLKNGCLVQSISWTSGGGGSGPQMTVTYDRVEDLYEFLVTVN
jgi:hypothetical protein